MPDFLSYEDLRNPSVAQYIADIEAGRFQDELPIIWIAYCHGLFLGTFNSIDSASAQLVGRSEYLIDQPTNPSTKAIYSS